ncbi:MAG: hypothetical protein M3337_08340 [Actinomycetota bacterium]|nr:hypothetical protein [Actinomycetota bacterium]
MIGTGAGGAALAGLTGWALSLAVPAAVIGAVHGGIAGSRRLYAWHRWPGLVAFVLDHTWALPTSTASLFSHAVAALRKDTVFVGSLSERQSRHVYIGGFRTREGFAISLGNTVSGLAEVDERRRALVTDHEDVHVWQSRWFGPLYPVLYLTWMLAGALAGLAVALVGRRRPVFKVVETYAYYANPFEWWAYSRAGKWPPRGAVDGIWRKPAVRSFGARRSTPPRS